MLKIKDNVDLRELEKFEFTTRPESEYYKYMYNDEYLWVNKHTRNIDMTSPIYLCKFNKCLSIIDKLKKAGLVEKVVE